jgi:ABC-type sugar transport system permease subunit
MLFRTLYYLPAVTSGIVIMLVWRDFFSGGDTGLMNVLTAPLFSLLNSGIHGINGLFHAHIAEFALTHDWLGDPHWAMIAVVLPAVWAGAGPGSIIYLAAMKNVPEEMYEAADLDGAGVWTKIRHITLPGLKPLIIINLVGVFIASFKAMENIFVMTGGGPLNATHVLGLEIWYNAFIYLKFGYATAAAWIMGALLIGFTMMQVRNLLRMRFSSAK